jgi:carnitine O-acetyltransferase
MLIQLHREANERPAPFVDHAGVLRDSKTGRPIAGHVAEVTEDDDAMGEFFSILDLCSVANIFCCSGLFLLRQRRG